MKGKEDKINYLKSQTKSYKQKIAKAEKEKKSIQKKISSLKKELNILQEKINKSEDKVNINNLLSTTLNDYVIPFIHSTITYLKALYTFWHIIILVLALFSITYLNSKSISTSSVWSLSCGWISLALFWEWNSLCMISSTNSFHRI